MNRALTSMLYSKKHQSRCDVVSIYKKKNLTDFCDQYNKIWYYYPFINK